MRPVLDVARAVVPQVLRLGACGDECVPVLADARSKVVNCDLRVLVDHRNEVADDAGVGRNVVLWIPVRMPVRELHELRTGAQEAPAAFLKDFSLVALTLREMARARVVLAEDWIEDLMLRGALIYEVELVVALALASLWSAARQKAPRGLEVILGVRAVAEPGIGAKRRDGER